MVLVKKEPWMAKGNLVRVCGKTGVIRTIVDYVCGASISPEHEGVKMVSRIYVQLKGVAQAWPFHAAEVDLVK